MSDWPFGSFVEHDVAAVVVLYDARIDMASRHVGRRVEVGDKSYCRYFFVDIAWQCSHQIAVFVERNILQAHFFQLFFKCLRKNHLPGSGGGQIGQFVTLSVEFHVVQKSFDNVHNINFCKVCDLESLLQTY